MIWEDRPHQEKAINAVQEEYLKGTYRQLLAMATGTGKTVIFSRLPDKLKNILPGQTLVLAHREELVDQAIDKIRNINPHLKVDKEMAEHKADTVNSDVVVASVATLGRKNTKRIDRFNWNQIDKIITDEAHHSVATTYQNIYEAAGVLRSDSKKLLLGVTATPNGRGDGKALAQIYSKIVYTYGIRQAIEDGWLVDICSIRVNTKTSLDTVATVAGDFAQNELADTVNNPARNQLIVKAWLDNANNRQTVVFSVDIQHAKDLAEMFRHYGVKAEALWGDDPDRANKLARHKNKDLTVLINCGVLTEGYDDWQISCIVLARPTKSSILFTQMVGRGTRLQDGTGNLLIAKESWTDQDGELKQDCIVIDVVDNSFKHSLITLPTLLGMSGNLDLRGKSLVRSLKLLESKQEEFPNVDFSALTDINDLSQFIESVNLFEVKFRPEVEQNSKLGWHVAADGGFIIQLPDKDFVRINQNLLDQWEISAIIKQKKYKGIRNTIEEAFQGADGLIYKEASDSLKILNRKEKWHSNPPTDKQLKMLAKIYRGKAFPKDLDRGQASKLISAFLAGKQ